MQPDGTQKGSGLGGCLITVFALIGLYGLLSPNGVFSTSSDSTSDPDPDFSALVEKTPEPKPQPVPEFSVERREMVREGIKGYDQVIDAAVSQDGDTIRLTLVVRPGTNRQTARELCENFVRMAKSLSPDTSPTKEIGTGIYDYVVAAYTPDQTRIFSSAKAKSSPRLAGW